MSQSLACLIRIVANRAGITEADILGQSRLRKITEHRQFVMYLAHKRGMSLPQIGRIMGRHHTTVLHGVRAEAARRK